MAPAYINHLPSLQLAKHHDGEPQARPLKDQRSTSWSTRGRPARASAVRV
ncbi:hypothetical protein M2161_000969 [Streptomyces sp. SAI-133]|nr:hypothetical protein [Streptomyces sp. SAI-133]MDH6581863.1 hypothetical protein [Streptomyces sp. SAI-133]